MGHLVLGQLCGRPEGHVALWTGVELVCAMALDDGGRDVLLLGLLVLAAEAQGGHTSAEGGVLGYAFPLLVDEAVAGQAGAVVELLAADVAGVDAPLPV